MLRSPAKRKASLVPRFAVVVVAPPGNTSFSAGFVSEAALLPRAIGHFHLAYAEHHSSPPALSAAAADLLLPVDEARDAPRHHFAASLRSLLGWGAAAPLRLHLVGRAASIAHTLTLAAYSPPGAGGDALRALRAHQFSACALRLADAYAAAWRGRFPHCVAPTVDAHTLRLLAPALVRQRVARVLILDPLAILMVPPTQVESWGAG